MSFEHCGKPSQAKLQSISNNNKHIILVMLGVGYLETSMKRQCLLIESVWEDEHNAGLTLQCNLKYQ